jgi:hypothetical protein
VPAAVLAVGTVAIDDETELARLLTVPRATMTTCPHIETILATMKTNVAAAGAFDLPGWAAADTTAKKIDFLKTLPILNHHNCNRVMGGECKDSKSYQLMGSGCEEWAEDWNMDGIPDCNPTDTDAVKSCSNFPSAMGKFSEGFFQCEVGAYFYAGAYIPNNIADKGSPNYMGADVEDGMIKLRKMCPLSCYPEGFAPTCLP